MNCGYCNASTEPEDHRCSRCGRRLNPDASARVLQVAGSAALAPHFDDAPVDPEVPLASPARDVSRPQLVAAPATPQPGSREYRYQASLFGPQEAAKRTPVPAKRSKGSSSARSAEIQASQQELDFGTPTGQAARRLDTSVQAAIWCNAPVALATHRMMAAMVDLTLSVLAVGLFLLTFYLGGGEVLFTKQTTAWYVAAIFLIALFYRVLYCVAGRDSAGLQWTGLRIVNFDGHEPSASERVQRVGAGVVSFGAAGLGLLWGMLDEERLTWHDHISKTFPTPDAFAPARRD